MVRVKSCIDTFRPFLVESRVASVDPFHIGFDRDQGTGTGLGVGRMTRRGVKLCAQCTDDFEDGGEARVFLAG